MNAKERAIDGFRIMYQVKISAVPIIDEEGKLVGCLSSSDVRNLHEGNIEDVLLPVLQYLVRSPLAYSMMCEYFFLCKGNL